MTGSPENNNDDFIEIYNPTDFDSDLSACSIQYRGGSGNNYYKKTFTASSFIPSHGYFLVAHGDGYSGTAPYDMSWIQSFSESGGTIFLVNSTKPLSDLENNILYIIDKLGYGNAKEFEQEPAAKPKPGQSISRKNFIDSNNNLKDFMHSLPSPRAISIEIPAEEEHYEDEEEEEESPSDEDSKYTGQSYASGVRLNEIFPNPKGDEKEGEFIELYNEENFSVDLKDWTLKDASKTKFVFPSGKTIEAGGYLTVYRPEFKFALNNTGLEDVFLLDPNGDIVSEATYDGAKEETSFSFDGSGWRWSKYLTPGKANRFGTSSKIKAVEIKEGYVGVPVEFSLEAEHANFSKVTWDFGDKKKSYLKNPTHTYFKKGKYKIKVSASGETENVSDSFTLKIKDYPRENVELLALVPNPLGRDLGQEWIEIRNNEKDVINLKGWKIATGQKNLINHVIKTDFEIGPGESRQITREDTFFTLHNQGMTLELRYPDGKMADKVTYAKDKIADDEIYAKEDGRWIWFSSEDDVFFENMASTEENDTTISSQPTQEKQPLGVVSDNAPEHLGKFSTTTEWQNKKKNKFIHLTYGLKINTTLLSFSPTYGSRASAFTPLSKKDSSFIKINSFFNNLFF